MSGTVCTGPHLYLQHEVFGSNVTGDLQPEAVIHG